MNDFLVILLVVAIILAVMKAVWWAADHVLGTDPPKSKVDLHYDPLAVDEDINIPAPAKRDLRYDPLSTDEDIWVPIRPRPPSQS